jgi:hypothetical protein
MNNALSDFISSERDRFETKDNNTFAFAFSEVSRYFAYLEIIAERYRKWQEEYRANTQAFQDSILPGHNALTSEQQQLYEDGVKLSTLLHLEIETFYLMAKILLDKIAQAVEFYFGPERSLPLSSHDKLSRNFKKYHERKSLEVSAEIFKTIDQLKSDISDFRDYQISHIVDYRRGRIVRGTAFSNTEGDARLSIAMLYPGKKDKQYDSRPLTELLRELDEYVIQVVQLIEHNTAKTHLMLVDKERVG